MYVSCPICVSVFSEGTVCDTPCGHVFHKACLSQWLKNSRTCPQCRRTVCENKLNILYFNYTDSKPEYGSRASNIEAELKEINKYKKQLQSLEQSVKESKEKNRLLDRQKTQFTKEICNLNMQLDQKQQEIDRNNKQIQELKRKMQSYQKIETLLNSTIDDTSEIISEVNDPEALHTYIVVMKRELLTSVNRQRELRNKVRNLQAELGKVPHKNIILAEIRDKNNSLEAELMNSERKRLMLQYKINQLEANASTNTPSFVDTRPTVTEENTENSPYLRVKSQGVFAAREHSEEHCQTTKPGFSIFAKKKFRVIPPNGNSVTTSNSTYDGYGGHVKYDRFPSPISGVKLKRSVDEIKRENKKPKFDSDENQKLNEILDIPSLK